MFNMNKNEMFCHIKCRLKIRAHGVVLLCSRVTHAQIVLYPYKYAYSHLKCAFLVHRHTFALCDVVLP